MREQIAETLFRINQQDQEKMLELDMELTGSEITYEKCDWGRLQDKHKKFYYEQADQILALIYGEIGKVENLDNGNPYIEEFRQQILSLFKGAR